MSISLFIILNLETFQPPQSLQPSRDIDIPAINVPHPGTSYNPSVQSHQSLLRAAHNVEVVREAEAQKWRDAKAAVEAIRAARVLEEGESYDPSGAMAIDVPVEEEAVVNVEVAESVEAPVRKTPVRKTQLQRRKAAKVLAEVRKM